jgi:uncharacterized protein (TIGR02118 family)
MVKFCVIYQGRPAQPEEFDRYYRATHVPILIRFPKIRRLTVNRARQLNEAIYMVVELFFDSFEDLEGALASPERREAAADRRKFPHFYGTILHQVLEVNEFPLGRE